MICSSCGGNNPDGAIFCARCGNVLTENAQSEPETKPRRKKGLILILSFVAIAALAVIVICLLGGGHGFSEPEDAALAAIEGAFDLDTDLLLEALYPEMAEDYEEEIEEGMEEMEELMEENNVSAEHFKAKDTKKAFDKTTISGYEDLLNETYDLDIEITDMKQIEVSCDADIDGDEERLTECLTVFEVDGKWYVWPKEFGIPSGYNEPEEAALVWVKGCCNADADAMLQSVYPEVVEEIENTIRKEAKWNQEDIEEFEYSFSNYTAAVEHHAWDGNTMAAIEDYLEMGYDSQANATDLCHVVVSFDMSSIYGSSKDDMSVMVVRINEKWYVWPSDYIDLY